MKRLIISTILFLLVLAADAQRKEVPVFTSGEDGYKSYRIPAIIRLKDGKLIAFCEGRVNGPGDYGNNDIVMKTSTDDGETWSGMRVVADLGELQLCNPAPVVDMTDPSYPDGRIFLFYNSGNNHEGEILKGNGIKYCLYKTSVDGGNTWSEPVDITLQVHRPNKPDINPEFNFKEDWRYFANTPGHAMQFQSGRYKGRIFIASNHSEGEPKKDAGHYLAHGYFTDDHGLTFKIGNSLDIPGSNESIAAELSENRLIMNSRNQKGDIRARIVSFSSDGGATWDTTYFDMTLPDPVCQGSILSLGKRNGKEMLAFCNPADEKRRDNLTLRISYDEGLTWEMNIPIYKCSDLKENLACSAYSDLVKLDKKHIGVLYEKDNYSTITFTMVKWK